MRYHCSFNGDSHFDVGVIFEPTGIESLTMSESEFIVDVNQESFSSTVVEASMKVPVLLDFWASWCGPCRMVSPIVDEIAAENPDKKVGKVNVDEEPELASKFDVMSIPTLLVFEDGELVNRAVGARPKEMILDLFEE